MQFDKTFESIISQPNYKFVPQNNFIKYSLSILIYQIVNEQRFDEYSY